MFYVSMCENIAFVVYSGCCAINVGESYLRDVLDKVYIYKTIYTDGRLYALFYIDFLLFSLLCAALHDLQVYSIQIIQDHDWQLMMDVARYLAIIYIVQNIEMFQTTIIINNVFIMG